MSADLEHSRSRLDQGVITERVTIRIPTSQIEDIDDLVDEGEFASRSQAIRAGVDVLVAECDRDE